MARTMTDADLDRAATVGSIRLDNEHQTDSPMFIPPAAPWTKDRRAFFTHQKKVMSAEVLMNHYLELLVRTSALLEFMHHNVGVDDEWPLTILGDSEEVETHFGDLIGQLESSVGCLTEV
jgi:hypothetical protein